MHTTLTTSSRRTMAAILKNKPGILIEDSRFVSAAMVAL
jgi:hypothetical protein